MRDYDTIELGTDNNIVKLKVHNQKDTDPTHFESKEEINSFIVALSAARDRAFPNVEAPEPAQTTTTPEPVTPVVPDTVQDTEPTLSPKAE